SLGCDCASRQLRSFAARKALSIKFPTGISNAMSIEPDGPLFDLQMYEQLVLTSIIRKPKRLSNPAARRAFDRVLSAIKRADVTFFTGLGGSYGGAVLAARLFSSMSNGPVTALPCSALEALNWKSGMSLIMVTASAANPSLHRLATKVTQAGAT